MFFKYVTIVCEGLMKEYNKAYTLAEVVLTMMVIAVIVGVSLKIAKTKLDSIISFNYYNAYSIIKTSVAEMLADFNPSPDRGYVFAPMVAYASSCACGSVYDEETGNCVSSSCQNGYEWNCDSNVKACVAIQRTIPRTGNKFCNLFISYINTKSGVTECEGSSVDNNTTDFSELIPDVVFRNGMFLYNISTSDVEKLDILNGIEQGISYGVVTDSNYVPNANEYGYLIYIDIDGKNSNSILWEDVFPFYITLSGKVVPAYADNMEAGGNSKLHIQASVLKEKYTDGLRSLSWPVKSVSFTEAACVSGYLHGSQYCDGITTDSDCLSQDVDCQLKVLKPFKFF